MLNDLLNWNKPWHEFVPRGINDNRLYRAELLKISYANELVQEFLIKVCRADILFWFNSFVWTYQPRDMSRPVIRPMITWQKQDEVITEIVKRVRQPEDSQLNLEKSREQGGTWLVLGVFDWFGRFDKQPLSFLCASRNQEMVDDAENTDTLFSKLDFLQAELPPFMQQFWIAARRKENQIKYQNRTIINGQATTTDLSRGGRRTAIMLDEASKMRNQAKIDNSVGPATHVAIKVATPDGPNTQFSRDRKKPGITFITMHWSENPQHNKGLYIPHADGTIDYVNKVYWTKERIDAYDFKLFLEKYPTSNPRFPQRSPYYDQICLSKSRSYVAENLDINDYGSKSLFYTQTRAMTDDFQRVREACTPPVEFGMLEYDRETAEPTAFLPMHNWGKISFDLWLFTGGQRPPADRQYAIGCDISQGTGYSYSTLSIGDIGLRSKVAELKTAWLEPRQFAVLAVAVAKWFNNARLNWGKQGTGVAFSKRIYELDYRMVYSRTADPWNEKWSSTPGVSEDQDSKLAMHTNYRSALYEGQFENPSAYAVDECLQYQYNDSGYVEHSTEADPEDSSDAKKNHGDMVVADAMLNIIFGAPVILNRDPYNEKVIHVGPRPNTLAWRMKQYALQDAEAEGERY